MAMIRFQESCATNPDKWEFFDSKLFVEVISMGGGCEIVLKNGKSRYSQELADVIQERINRARKG
jgi:hypothetical protein